MVGGPLQKRRMKTSLSFVHSLTPLRYSLSNLREPGSPFSMGFLCLPLSSPPHTFHHVTVTSFMIPYSHKARGFIVNSQPETSSFFLVSGSDKDKECLFYGPQYSLVTVSVRSGHCFQCIPYSLLLSSLIFSNYNLTMA
jgi:hypothetical protein